MLLSKEYTQVKIIDENSLKIPRRSLEAIQKIRTKDALPKEKILNINNGSQYTIQKTKD
jgi:hypothetical protein